MMASNEDWIIPATKHERRYFVVHVSNCKRQDPKWFGDLNRQMENGGLEAMLYDLLRRDISDFNPRNVPESSALLDQQEANLGPLEVWWREILESGVIPESNHRHPNWGSSERMIEHAKRSSPKLSSFLTPQMFSKFLTTMGAEKLKRGNLRGYTFPDLLEARANWEATYPGTFWEEPDLTSWQAENSPASEEIANMIHISEEG